MPKVEEAWIIEKRSGLALGVKCGKMKFGAISNALRFSRKEDAVDFYGAFLSDLGVDAMFIEHQWIEDGHEDIELKEVE
jgi:hypothetical protein